MAVEDRDSRGPTRVSLTRSGQYIFGIYAHQWRTLKANLNPEGRTAGDPFRSGSARVAWIREEIHYNVNGFKSDLMLKRSIR